VASHGFGIVSHVGVPGPAVFVAMGLFLAGLGAGVGSYVLHTTREKPFHRVASIGLGVVAFGSLGLATAVPILYHVPVGRPTTAARIRILSPHPNEVFHGNPATVPVDIDVEGGTVTPVTSLHLVPDTGHVHLFVDGHLVTMTGVATRLEVAPGSHTLRAEFVAMDHGPFRPRVTASVTFVVQG
jgi:hypothetical protein